ncbi:MAG: hypothetical protein MUO90_03645 [Dehalococcoidales bacterium]|nr:hypothetical protein [Dehalococcoidales bacterium]
MTRVIVKPGVCGFTTIIEIDKIDKKRLSCKIESDCQTVAALGNSLSEINKWDVLKPRSESGIYLKLSEHPLHLSCPVPVGIIKAVEVEAGLALARDVSIHFETPGED